MYYALFSVLACFTICHGLTKDDEKKRNDCDVLKPLLESSAVSVKLRKNGFHRELVTSVEFGFDDLKGLRVLLVHRWPRGVYIDPYQLSSLGDQRNWKILIDSSVDLELPAHKTSGFVTYLYPDLNETSPRLLTVTVPIHARYHEPSFVETLTSVNIKPPELLLRTEQCTHPISSESHSVIDAPCTSDKLSTCAWLRLHQQQDQISVTVHVPVGDRYLVIPVSVGTLLVTIFCCVRLSKYMWKHRIKQ